MNWLGLLGIVLVVAKLTGYLAWSWIVVLSPFWIPLTVFGFCFGGYGGYILATCLAAANK